MSVFRITFLGTAGAAPTIRRGLSATSVRIWSDRLLIDCGEGTQRQMLRYGTGFRTDRIFFTHFHADHYIGIIGFLRTLCMNERTEPLVIYGPEAGMEKTLKPAIHLGWKEFSFPLKLEILEPGQVIDRGKYSIKAIRTDHRMPSLGYVLEEPPRPGRFDPEAAKALGIAPGPLFGKLQKGEEIVLPGGKLIKPCQVMGLSRSGRKVVFSGDTRPCDSVMEAAQSADLLVHEATFSNDEKERAAETMHSTAKEAGEIAEKAGVKSLILTHISSRYDNTPHILASEAKEVFSGDVAAAEDGMRRNMEYID